MRQGGGGEEAVDGWQRSARLGAQPTPALGYPEIDRQQARPKPGQKDLFEPVSERHPFLALFQLLDAFADLTDGQDAEMESASPAATPPSSHPAEAALALAIGAA
jgi:hypothetical protein